MDPDATLRELRKLAGGVLDDPDRTPVGYGDDRDAWKYLALDLAEKFNALDDWLSKGSFPPADWNWRATA